MVIKMQKTNEIRNRLVNDFAEHYLEKVFYFCLKKTGCHTEAEDLTQDIACSIIAALNTGMIPENFSAWIWQIARNRYSVWATKKHNRNASVTGSDICDYEIEDPDETILDQMIYAEQLALLRRELAFIRSDYRHILVAYYLENKSVRLIASSLSLLETTVKQRLYRARMILKEGMDMAREFGKRSYHPEQVSFVQSGKDGKRGQPWSIITHLLYKNIFLEAYENPQTAEELSLELGIALPYMEDELEFLVEEQLLRKNGNQYQTNFPIISKEEQRKEFESNLSIQKPLTEKICALIDAYMREDGTEIDIQNIRYEDAKWALLVRTFDWLQWNKNEKIFGEEYRNEYPKRPDGGAWILTGYETIDWQVPAFVGENGYISHDQNEITIDINFGQYKFFWENIQQKTPTHLSYKEVYTLWLVCSGRTDECEESYIENLITYGYLKKENAEIGPNLVIFHKRADHPDGAALAQKLHTVRNEINDLLKQAPGISRGYVVDQAIQNGWLTYTNQTGNAIGAFIYI
ncbi:MAG: sigma-70 family RNA polymerase sigma factor [Clostridia bacterium]|nr:sigma-70 family RNA polymerase sigma factor [Clostridia bacterium]